jgi:hypothetical protein
MDQLIVDENAGRPKQAALDRGRLLRKPVTRSPTNVVLTVIWSVIMRRAKGRSRRVAPVATTMVPNMMLQHKRRRSSKHGPACRIWLACATDKVVDVRIVRRRHGKSASLAGRARSHRPRSNVGSTPLNKGVATTKLGSSGSDLPAAVLKGRLKRPDPLAIRRQILRACTFHLEIACVHIPP